MEQINADEMDWTDKIVLSKAELEAKLEALREQVLKEVGRGKGSPEIVCLCGSTRFTDIMLIKQWELTKRGKIVVSWCALPDYYFEGEEKAHIGDQEGVKEIVDRVHFRKIDLCDRVFVINKGGYIGESTTNEINYAKSIGKPIEYLEALKSGTMPNKETGI